MKFKEMKSRMREVLETQATSYDYDDTLLFIADKCEQYGATEVEFDRFDNLYVTKGKADVYPCVVSHTDTVHDIYKGYEVIEKRGNFFGFDTSTMKQVGVGGDDKVGIWVCLEMLKHFDNIKVVFFAQEEIGCIGSAQADKDFFKDVGFAFECDRKGNSDFVQTSSGVKMFDDSFKSKITPVLKSYGYSITEGGLTDVHEIAQDMDISCANMSCGYYNPHSSSEYVNIKDAINTCRLVKDLVDCLGENSYPHKAEHSYGSYGSYYGGYGSYQAYGGSGWISSPKPTKKVNNKTNPNSVCTICEAPSTDGCDFCNQESQGSKEGSEPCSCGGTYDVYNKQGDSYKWCKSCGHYEEIKEDINTPF